MHMMNTEVKETILVMSITVRKNQNSNLLSKEKVFREMQLNDSFESVMTSWLRDALFINFYRTDLPLSKALHSESPKCCKNMHNIKFVQ